MLNWKCHALVDVAHPFPTSLSPIGSCSRWTITSFPGRVVYAMLTCESKNTTVHTYQLLHCKSGSILHRHSIHTYPTSNLPLWVYWADIGRSTCFPEESLAHRYSGQYVTTSTLDQPRRECLREPFLVKCWAQCRRSIILWRWWIFAHVLYLQHWI